MPRVFLSHSSRDSRSAIAVKAWLVEQEPGLAEEIFLDLDPHTGIRPGERWKQALQQANTRCEAVICLLSAHWEASRECTTEYRYAETLNKTILCGRLEPVPDTGITSEWQRCDLFVGDGPTAEIAVDGGAPVVLSTQGLQRLLGGLRALGIGAEHFRWPPPGDPERAPYRGWAPLEEADAAVFFGRDAQILRGLDVLRGMRASGVQSLFVILGPSGAGKSSFLRAGLLPRLRRDDRRFLPLPIVRPEQAVLTGEHGLAQAIHRLRTSLGLHKPVLGEIKSACHPDRIDRLRRWLEESRDTARARLLDMPADQPCPTLVFPLDQAEELFNVDAGPEAACFLQLLAGLLQSQAGVTPAVIVALTIRADRYEPLQITPQLAEVHSVVFDELKPMPAAGYTEVITGPARRATAAGRRLNIEPALVEWLLADAAEGADALPLLALTLERLYHDFGADGELTVADYEALGGLTQVVQTEVGKLLAADPDQRQAQLELLHDAFIPWLATINPDNDQPMRRLVRYTDLPAASHPLIDAFVEKRLLVKDTRNAQVVVEVALESLLRQWDELAAWLRDAGQGLKDADTLERAAADWQASGRDQAWLLEGTRLTDAETLAVQPVFRDRLDPTRDYLLASRARENLRIEAEKQHQQAEIQAAREKERAVVLRKRSRILISVLTAFVVLTVIALIASINAVMQAGELRSANRELTALRLVVEAQSMLAGAHSGGDARAFQQILAAGALANPPDDGPLYTALIQRASILKIITGHTGPLLGVAFSPDGARIASGSMDGTVRVWDAATGQPIGQPMRHDDQVTSVAFSPDGTRIASGRDKAVQVWDAATGQPIGQPLLHNNVVMGVAFSPNGARIASGSMDGTVRVWDAATGQPIGQPMRGQDSGVTRVAFSPDGARIASGGVDKTVRVWDAVTGQPIGQPLRGHDQWVMGVAFSPDGARIASGSMDNTVRVWDAATGQPIGQPMRHDDQVMGVAFSPDGTRIASGGADNTIRLWDASSGGALGVLTGHQSAVEAVAFSPDGRRLLTGGDDQTVRIWDAGGWQPIRGHDDTIGFAAFSDDGQHIRSGSHDGTVRVWDAATGRPMGQPLRVPDPVRWLDPFGEDRLLSLGENQLRLWDARTGKPIGEPLPVPSDPMLGAVAWTVKPARIATQTEPGAIEVRDADTMGPVGVPIWPPKPVMSFDLSFDGRIIATTSTDSTVRLWDVETGKPVGEPLKGKGLIIRLTFSRDGHLLAAAAQGGVDNTKNTVRVWDIRTRQPVGDPIGVDSAVTAVAFSRDGRTLATGSGNGTIRLWDVGDHTPLGVPLAGHTSTVTSLDFSPDGTKLLSASADHTLRIWPVPKASPDALCAKLTHNMSRHRWNEWVSPKIDYITVCPGLPIADDVGPR